MVGLGPCRGRGGKTPRSLGGEEGEARQRAGAVVVPASVAAAFKVIKTELVLQIPVVHRLRNRSNAAAVVLRQHGPTRVDEDHGEEASRVGGDHRTALGGGGVGAARTSAALER